MRLFIMMVIRMNKQVIEVKQKMQELNVSYSTVVRDLGFSKGWFTKMASGYFKDPNPDWVKEVSNYLKDVEKLQAKWIVKRSKRT